MKECVLGKTCLLLEQIVDFIIAVGGYDLMGFDIKALHT